VHDAGFGFIARAAATSLVERLRGRDVRGGLVVDLGCGSGIAARILIDAGYDVHGVDASADLIALARERAPEATFDHVSLHDATLPGGAVAVTAMGEVLCYAGVNDALLARVRGSLASGGLFVFDVATPDREGTDPRRSWHEGDGWLVCSEAWRGPEARRLNRRIAAFTRMGESAWSRSDEVHELELYEPAALTESLTAAGFEDARVDDDGYGSAVRIDGLAVLVGRAP
jgi:SAM-dependent methyltransferase